MKFYRFILIEQYLFSIKSKLLYPYKRKCKIIKKFRSFIYSCINDEETDDSVSCKEDLYNLFGTTDRVVKNYMDVRDESEAREYQKERKKKKFLLVLCAILLIAFFTFIIWNYLTSNVKIVTLGPVDETTSYFEEGH